MVADMELISALAADDWTSVPFVADFDRTLELEKLIECNSDVLGETDFIGFDDRVTVQNLKIIKNFLLTWVRGYPFSIVHLQTVEN